MLALTAALSAPAALAADTETATPRVIAQDGLEVLLHPLSRGDDGYKVVTVVRADGLAPYVTEIDVFRLAFGPDVTIGKLAATDALPSAMLQTFTGGAHCCTEVIVVTAIRDRLQAVEVGTFDGGPPNTFPEDLDGDGIADFQLRDDRFLYAFAPYAGSWAPPRFLNVVGDKVEDVTFRPGFEKSLKDFADRARTACTDPEQAFRNGACAAYVAIQAHLGFYEEALAEVQPFIDRQETSFLPIGCRVDVSDGVCPEDQEIRFTAFEPALDWFLKWAGYLR